VSAPDESKPPPPQPDELTRAIEAIRSDKGRINDLPQDVHNWFGNLVKLVRTGGIISGISSGMLITAFDENVVIPKIWVYRDRINNTLGQTWEKLEEVDPGLEVPVTFLGYADEWRNIGGTIITAGNSFSETDLKGEWTGDAADRFWAMRTRQAPAFTAMGAMCEKVATNLEAVAEAELGLYTDLSTTTHDLIEKVTGLIGSYLGSFFDLPAGPLSSLGDVAFSSGSSKYIHRADYCLSRQKRF